MGDLLRRFAGLALAAAGFLSPRLPFPAGVPPCPAPDHNLYCYCTREGDARGHR